MTIVRQTKTGISLNQSAYFEGHKTITTTISDLKKEKRGRGWVKPFLVGIYTSWTH